MVDFIPVDHNPFDTAVSANDPTAFHPPQQTTSEGYPYYQAGTAPSYPEPTPPSGPPAAYGSPVGPETPLAAYEYGPELSNPRTRDRLMAYTQAEVGGQGPAAQQSFIEATIRRAKIEGKTIDEVLSTGYYPNITHWRARGGILDDYRRSLYDPMIDEALSGSNVSNWATGNASGRVGFAGGPRTATYGGEKFGVEGWTLPAIREAMAGGELTPINGGGSPPRLVPVDYDPWERAAQRTRQSVQPEGGRTPGFATRLFENYVPHVAQGMLSLPQQAFEEAGSLQRGGSYDAGPAVNAATMTMGGTAFGAPRGAMGAGPVMPLRSEPLAPTFHSAVEQRLATVQVPKATGEQWLGMLRNSPGVKPEELQWLGVEDFLKGQKGPVTKEQVADYVRGHQVELKEVEKGRPSGVAADENLETTAQRIFGRRYDELTPSEMGRTQRELFNPTYDKPKFGSYTLPGGENYREMLLQMPERDASARYRELDRKGINNLTPAELEEFHQLDMNPPDVNFRSSHWDEPNVIAHVRFNDRTIDGKKTLFLEEIQSDWHQAGKRKGYQQKPDTSDWTAKPSSTEPQPQDNRVPGGWWNVYDATGNRVGTAPRHSARTAEEAIADVAQREKFSGVPDAPFKTTWPELALKRMIRYAAENGYEKIAWTPGEVQAARYDLSKQIKVLHYTKTMNGEGYLLGPETHSGQEVSLNNGKPIPPDQLADFIGKDVADKILKGEGKQTNEGVFTLSGLDLKVGGEGMKGFYDRMLVAAANKLGKKFGARVEVGEIPKNDAGWHIIPPDQNIYGDRWVVKTKDYTSTGEHFRTEAAARRFLEEQIQAQPVHALDITPQLRDTALRKGFPLFAIGGGMMFIPVDHNPFAGQK